MNREPKTIFEQILFGVEATNDNVVTLSENVNMLNERLDAFMGIFQMKPTDSGEEIGDPENENSDEVQ